MRAARKPLAAPNPDTVAPEEIRAWASPRTAQQRARRATKTRKTRQRERCTDPATCDRSFAEAELELMQAMQDYKQRSGRMFPTWSEVLEVVQGLGYQKQA
jgi:hypothetical protein